MKFIVDNIFLIAMALLSGAMLLWPVINRSRSGPGVGTLEATRMINDRNAVVLDVRSQAEFQKGHLPNARNIPAEDVGKRLGEVPSNRPVIVVCASGQRSRGAVAALKQAGRQDVVSLVGGIGAWQQASLPLVR